MRDRGRWLRRLIAVAAVLAVSLPGASAVAGLRSGPTVVAGHGQAGHYGAAPNGLGDDGVLRVLWGEGRSERMALMTARGRVLRRFTVARKSDPTSTPTIAAPLPGGRTVAQYEVGNRIVVASFDRTGRRLHIRRFRGVTSSGAKSPLISRGRDGAGLCWVGSGSRDVQVSVALISPAGVIGPRLRVMAPARTPATTARSPAAPAVS